MKSWGSLTSKVVRQGQTVDDVDVALQNQLFCRDVFRLRVWLKPDYYNNTEEVQRVIETMVRMSSAELRLFRAKPRLDEDTDWPRNFNLNYWATQ